MSRLVRLARLLPLAVWLAAAPASAGHELPFYPSFYPQEIRLDTLAPGAAAAGLAAGTLHAYVGGDAFAASAPPPHVRAVESLGSYLVLTWNARGSWQGDRCAGARALAGALAPGDATVGSDYRAHPYPVTPYHADYLLHADRVATARAALTSGASPRAPQLHAIGTRATALARGRVPVAGADADWTLEEIDAAELVGRARTDLDGWTGPPWLKQGWFHAWLLLRDTLSADAARAEADAVFRRLTGGTSRGEVERASLERRLVEGLLAGCERLVLGYAARREHYTAEFSAGVENIAWDSHAGLGSAIFLRTVKLKDFPWNGWLHLATPAPPAAAWNPVAGFTDPAGRLVWAAVGDPAAFPTPYAGGWIGNRAPAPMVSVGPVAPPPGTLSPEPGTGALRPVGAGATAGVKVVYRVLGSAFHDGTSVTTADLVYPYVLAARWGGSPAGGGQDHDSRVSAATAGLRDWLVGVKAVRVDATVREFAELKFATVTHTLEVYGRRGGLEPEATAAIAPPWSATPWHVTALMEEAVRRGIAAFSAEEARRRGVPWLDLVRDPAVQARLAALVAELSARGHVPEALERLVTRADARERWAALARFHQTHGHFLVTSGPYRLTKGSAGGAVLEVFRDFSYPLGVGSYDRYAIPRAARPVRVEAAADAITVYAEIEMVEKFSREYRLVREPLERPSRERGPRDVPECRYVAIAADGTLADTGVAPLESPGVFRVRLGGRVPPGVYAVSLALYLDGNQTSPDVRTVTYRVS